MPSRTSATEKDTPAVPYRNITSGRENPPSRGVCVKMIRIAARSSEVTSICVVTSMSRDAGYCAAERIHAPASSR